ncbi:phosphotransferase enzyme family protein [Alkalihalobacillus sp. 1P02AB]|uniref:phosphotransferase enzyme family protein n=1 Tax=Alkalihalobacillus sp. 1P02AB TaxID=3132260 RepID=UPI0039A66830
MEIKKVIAILDSWDLELKTAIKLSEKAAKITTINDIHFVLKRKKDKESIVREAKLLSFIQEQGINVQVLVHTKDAEFYAVFTGDVYCLYHFIEGETFFADECIRNPIVPAVLGETIASLHKAMASEQMTLLYPTKNLYNMVKEFAHVEINAVDNTASLAPIWAVFNKELEVKMNKLPKQVIHRDMHLFNMIYKSGELAEVIDFDQAEVNLRLFDLAYCSTSILNELFDFESKRHDWFLFVQELCLSYNETNPLSKEEQELIWHVMLAIQLIFMAFFLQDEHLYSRNKEMLLWLFENQSKLKQVW